MSKYCFGIDIGGTTVKCGLFTEDGSCQKKWEITTRKENHGSFILKDIADSILETIAQHHLNHEDIIGIGVGVPGPVTDEGTVLQCANLGWGIVPINEELKQLTGLKTVSGNDANVAALGEMWMGGAKGYDNVVMVTLGTGVGGGIIINGNMLAGSNGAAGEIGHMIMRPEETKKCGCGGHGHLEQYASATGIVRMAKCALASYKETTKLSQYPELTAKDVFDCAKDKDSLACYLIDELGKMLATAMVNIACVIDTEVFVIGGGVSKAGDILLDAIKRHYNDNTLFALSNKEFRLASLGNDAGIYGCAKMILG